MSETILQIISKRRSCRSFTTEQPTHQDIEVLIQAGQGAPIGMNFTNKIQLFVIQNKALLNEIEQNALDYFSSPEHQIANHKIKSAIFQAPTLIVVAIEKLDGPFQKAQFCSAACILENMILAATEMEIGSVYLSGVTTALNENRELLTKLGIPENYQAASAIAIGRKAKELQARDLTQERITTKWLA
jgi:Nitroreductase